MAVTASFEPDRVSSVPGATAAFTLTLRNDDDTDEVVKLKAAGELAGHTVLQTETIYLDPGETFDIPVVVDVGSGLTAGSHSSSIQISAGSGPSITAEATVEVLEHSDHTVELQPVESHSSRNGRHRVQIDNSGNVPVLVEITATPTGEEDVLIELATPAVDVAPGQHAAVELRVRPRTRYWSGSTQDHPFVVHTVGSDGKTHELNGVYVQGPRVRPWFVPAAVGALAALLIGALLWFAVLEPRVERIAEDAAEDALAADRARLEELIAELEMQAAEARELPLGVPTDLRLNASAAPGATGTEAFTVASDRVLSVTDVVFQNPDGAIGRVRLVRNGEVLLESQLANFRDLDFHFVAPYEFDGGSTVAVEVECETPGPGATECNVGLSITGFVDEAR